MTQLTNQIPELLFTEYCLTYSHIVPEFSDMLKVVGDNSLTQLQKNVKLIFMFEDASRKYLESRPMQWGLVEWAYRNFSTYLKYPEGAEGVQLQFLCAVIDVMFECVAAHDYRPKESHYVVKWYDKNGEETRCPFTYTSELTKTKMVNPCAAV